MFNPNGQSSRIYNFDNRVTQPKRDSPPVSKLNAILIVLDQAINYKLLPSEVLSYLPGYQAFKRIGIDLTNSFCNRTPCTASRGVIQTGCLNTGIQDTIYKDYQRRVVPCISPTTDTISKIFQTNGYHTAYFGKYHLESKFYSNYCDIPMYNTSTRQSLKVHGFDQYSQTHKYK